MPTDLKFNAPIQVNVEDLEQISSFKYNGLTIAEEVISKIEEVSRIGSALSKLNKICRERQLPIEIKVNLLESRKSKEFVRDEIQRQCGEL